MQNNWKSLTRSYNKAKDTKDRTEPIKIFEFCEDVLEIKPSDECGHSVNSMDIEKKIITKAIEKNVEIVWGTSPDSELKENKENRKRKKS